MTDRPARGALPATAIAVGDEVDLGDGPEVVTEKTKPAFPRVRLVGERGTVLEVGAARPVDVYGIA